jgi:hypothetical protein
MVIALSDLSIRPRRAMSEMGQKAKYSLRAHIVRIVPESGLKSDLAGRPFRAMNGRGARLIR